MFALANPFLFSTMMPFDKADIKQLTELSPIPACKCSHFLYVLRIKLKHFHVFSVKNTMREEILIQIMCELWTYLGNICLKKKMCHLMYEAVPQSLIHSYLKKRTTYPTFNTAIYLYTANKYLLLKHKISFTI